MTRLAIVADDLTGAADTGASFAGVGLTTVIALHAQPPVVADVVVISTESRESPAADAARAVATAVRRLRLDRGTGTDHVLLYKKIDSALRGHPRDELLAAMSAVGATSALVVPAFPAEERTTVGGRQLVAGVPLEASRLAGLGACSDLAALFANDAGLPVRLLDLATFRSGRGDVSQLLAVAPGITIADAETDADLLLLARAAIASPMTVLCGAAGLARQLARLLSTSTAKQPALSPPRTTGPVLIVAGSRHAAIVRQIAALRDAGLPVIRPPQELIDDPRSPLAATVTEVAANLAAGTPTALTTMGLALSPRGGKTIAARLAQIATAPVVRDRFGGLVMTGGDVAAAVCAALGAAAIRLGGEVAPGLPWGVLDGGARPGLPIATKAGSFGGEDALLMASRFLMPAEPGDEAS
jgi:uncharacterized protein YgbK (DUF1537 family)